MEHSLKAYNLPEYIERWLNVDTHVLFDGKIPQGVWFRYFDGAGNIVENVLPVDPDFDCNAIYGGLMAWDGRYVQTDSGLELIAVKFAGEWHDLPTA